MSAKLRECPFCGLDVTRDEGCFPVNHARDVWEVRCGNPSCFAHEPSAESREAAIARWNRRATDRYELTDAGREALGGGANSRKISLTEPEDGA